MPRPPFSILDFVGQQKALSPILREQDGARARGEPSPHILFSGQSGLGKSRAAEMLAQRAKTNRLKFSGNESLEVIVDRLRGMRAGDIAFFDEAHKLSKNIQEMLYEVIDTSSIPSTLAPSATAHEAIKIEPITLIFATDQPGSLENPLQKRIPSHVHFKPYPVQEIKEIVSRVANGRHILLSAQAALRLAEACNGLPRRAEHHVQRIRLFFENSEDCQLGLAQVQEYLGANGVGADGFGKTERSYLLFLARNQSASLDALSGYLGFDAAFIRMQIEQPLRYRGLITVRQKGRVLTRKGKKWVRQFRQARTKKEK